MCVSYFSQGFKTIGGASAVGVNVAKIKAEAEKLELMDKAAGILGELLFTEQMLNEIKQYRIILLHVSVLIHNYLYKDVLVHTL